MSETFGPGELVYKVVGDKDGVYVTAAKILSVTHQIVAPYESKEIKYVLLIPGRDRPIACPPGLLRKSREEAFASADILLDGIYHSAVNLRPE